MTSFKGRHLGFLAVLFVGWATARIIIIDQDGADQDRRATAIAARPVPAVTKAGQLGTIAVMAGLHRPCCLQPVRLNGQDIIPARSIEKRALVELVAKDIATTVASGPGQPPIVQLTTARPAVSSANNFVTPSAPLLAGRRSLRADVYAYSFLRARDGKSALAAGGQYGGSQSGVIATFSFQRASDVEKPQMLALLVRTAVAHDNINEREVALGVRWRPIEKVPVSFTAERRFRHDRKDAFAIYAAGGVSDVRLPLKFRGESFAQAGVVGGEQSGPFFDGFARVDRKLPVAQGVEIHAGAGAWAGGQRDAARLDIGPSLRTDIRVRETSLRLNLDWRFRVAGNAAPGNGPALTLSTGF